MEGKRKEGQREGRTEEGISNHIFPRYGRRSAHMQPPLPPSLPPSRPPSLQPTPKTYRHELNSGFVTMMASSAKYMACFAPLSIPAGESQMMKSNSRRISESILPTPSTVRAFLSLVCEAARRYRFGLRLSLIMACLSVQSPCRTWTKSKITLRSAP